MPKRSHLVLLAVLVTASFTIVSAYAATSIDGERDVEVSVAGEDEKPYLGVEKHSPDLSEGTHTDVELLTVQHSLDVQTQLHVVTTVHSAERGQSPTVERGPSEQTLSVGEEKTLSGTVQCSGNTTRSETFEMDVSVTGDDISLEFTEDITITCTTSNTDP